jgi:hypothetical protein
MLHPNDIKPLQPLSYGSILIVGTKASNFDDELRKHPRIIMWESQNEHWLTKELPEKVRAVFVTRFIGHDAFTNIIKQARKRQVTIFNPTGTGMIVRQVRELLDLTRKETVTTIEETTVTTTPVLRKTGGKIVQKLHVLHPFIDFSRGPMDNARDILMPKAKEMGIETTVGSLAQMVSMLRKKRTGVPKATRRKVQPQQMDVSVDVLNNVIKELQDLRDYLVATVKENNALKLRIEKFKKALDND